MNKIIAGIDIGSNGACCVRTINGTFKVYKPEKYGVLFRVFQKYKDKTIIYIEKLHAFPGMSSRSLWAMSENQGIIIGMLDTLGLNDNAVWVPSQRWQKPLNLPKKQEYKQRKTNLHMKAMELFPDEKLFKYNADAYLICDFGCKEEIKKNE